MSSPPRSSSFSGSYESSSHDDRDDQPGGVPSTLQPPNSFPDQHRLANGKAKGVSKQSRPTHFVCFPLVTDSSIPQLAESLRRFRDVTTAPPAIRPPQIQQMEREAQAKENSGPSPTGTEDVTSVGNGAVDVDGNEGLEIIPAAAHRPPGTFHLTVGVMDLSDKGEMQRALEVLKTIDYTSLLQSLASTQPVNDNSNGIVTDTKEIAMDATRPDTSNSSASTLNANPSTEAKPSNPNSYRETVSRIDRAILHATPNSPTYKKEERERNPDSYRDTVSKIDRAIVHATPDINAQRVQGQMNATRREVSGGGSMGGTFFSAGAYGPSAGMNGNRPGGHGVSVNGSNGNMNGNDSNTTLNSTVTSTTAATNGNTNPRSHQRNPSTDIYGRSGYKETVSTVDRYVDKTYNKASRVKQAVKKPLKSRSGRKDANGRDVSPSRESVASTMRRRLLSLDSSRIGSVSVSPGGRSGDGESLYTITSNSTERPAAAGSHRESVATVKTSGPADKAKVAATPSQPRNTRKQRHSPSASEESQRSPPHEGKNPLRSPVDPSGILLAFTEAIRRILVREGVVRDEGRELVLHATVANMSKAKVQGRGKGKGKGVVDARHIIRYFNGGAKNGSGADNEAGEGMIWAKDVLLDRIRICRMGAEKSKDPVLGMVYPAIEVDVDDTAGEGWSDEPKARHMEKAEVVFA